MMKNSDDCSIDVVLEYIQHHLKGIINTNQNALIRPYLLVYLEMLYKHKGFATPENTPVEYEDRWYYELNEEINNAPIDELIDLSKTVIENDRLLKHFVRTCEQFHEDKKFFDELGSSLVNIL
jgi:hypothetical protein